MKETPPHAGREAISEIYSRPRLACGGRPDTALLGWPSFRFDGPLRERPWLGKSGTDQKDRQRIRAGFRRRIRQGSE